MQVTGSARCSGSPPCRPQLPKHPAVQQAAHAQLGARHSPSIAHGQRARACCAQLRLIFSVAALADVIDVEAFAACQVAKQLWPASVPGPPALYVQYLRKLWSAVSEPLDSVLMTRVLAEEGVIGARCAQASCLSSAFFGRHQQTHLLFAGLRQSSQA